MTVKEVADVYRFGPETVRRWIRLGRLRAIRVGNELRIRRRDLDAALDRSWERGR